MLKILFVIISLFVSSVAFADGQAKKDGSMSYSKETDDGFFCTFSITKDNGLFVEGSGVAEVMLANDIEYEPEKESVVMSASSTLHYGGEELSDITVRHQKGYVFTREAIMDIGDALVGSCLAEIVFLPQEILAKVGYKLPTTIVKK